RLCFAGKTPEGPIRRRILSRRGHDRGWGYGIPSRTGRSERPVPAISARSTTDLFRRVGLARAAAARPSRHGYRCSVPPTLAADGRSITPATGAIGVVYRGGSRRDLRGECRRCRPGTRRHHPPQGTALHRLFELARHRPAAFLGAHSLRSTP